MAAFTLKIDTNLLNDKAYFKLTSDAKAMYLAIVAMCNADGGGVSLEDLEHMLRAKNAVALRCLRDAGFIAVDGDMIYPRSDLIRKHTDTRRIKEWREEKRQQPAASSTAPNTLQNQPALQPAPRPAQHPQQNQPAPILRAVPTPLPEKPEPAPVVYTSPSAASEAEFDGWDEPEESNSMAHDGFALAEPQEQPQEQPQDLGMELVSFLDQQAARSEASEWQLVDPCAPPSNALTVACPLAFKPVVPGKDLTKTQMNQAKHIESFYKFVEEGVAPEMAAEYVQKRMDKSWDPFGVGQWSRLDRTAKQFSWSRLDCLITLCERGWMNVEPKFLEGLAKPTGLYTKPAVGGVPDGYVKDGFGKLKKRSAGVAL